MRLLGFFHLELRELFGQNGDHDDRADCSPLPVGVHAQNVQRIAEEAAARNVGRLVLGLPKNMDGTEGPRAALSRELAEQLRETTGLEVVLWDERRSSIEAHAILHANGRKEKDHRKTVDAVAASLMLEGYLRSQSL